MKTVSILKIRPGKEAKNSYRYFHESGDHVFSSIYILKESVKGKPPRTIQVRIDDAD